MNASILSNPLSAIIGFLDRLPSSLSTRNNVQSLILKTSQGIWLVTPTRAKLANSGIPFQKKIIESANYCLDKYSGKNMARCLPNPRLYESSYLNCVMMKKMIINLLYLQQPNRPLPLTWTLIQSLHQPECLIIALQWEFMIPAQ